MKALAMILLLAAFAPQPDDPLPTGLAGLVHAERSFAAACARQGIRESFLQFFADDVVTFGAELHRGKARWQKMPPDPPDGPKLRWEPVYGDISRAGDLGYTTGPYAATKKSGDSEHGIFFSIWKKQPGGAWKVIVDAGLPTPAPEGTWGRAFQPAPRVPVGTASLFDAEPTELMEQERSFGETAQKEDIARALSVYGDSSLRLHRTGVLPLMGTQQVRAYLADHVARYTFSPAGSGMASSGDLAFVYGSYQEDSSRRGLYVRVWRRDEQGQWRVVLDSLHPVPQR